MQLLRHVDTHVSSNLGSFWPLFLQIIFSAPFFSLFLDLPVKCMLVDLMPSPRSLEFSSFFFPIYPSSWSLFNWLICTFTNSSASSTVLLSPFSEIFISLFIHFNSRNSFWYFKKKCNFCLPIAVLFHETWSLFTVSLNYLGTLRVDLRLCLVISIPGLFSDIFY